MQRSAVVVILQLVTALSLKEIITTYGELSARTWRFCSPGPA
jgi:hypothetical protein